MTPSSEKMSTLNAGLHYHYPTIVSFFKAHFSPDSLFETLCGRKMSNPIKIVMKIDGKLVKTYKCKGIP